MQKKRQPQYTFLYSLQGYRYCDLLLGQGKYREVMERAEEAIKIARRNNWLLDISLDNLSLGRAGLMKSITEDSRDFTRALEFLNRAVTGLREAGAQEFLVKGLFARAECYRMMNQFAHAWDDLNEAYEIAESGGMKLFLCDFHLEAGRLCQAEKKEEEAGEHLSKARELVKETGYLRREEEIGNKAIRNKNYKLQNTNYKQITIPKLQITKKRRPSDS